MSNSINNNQTLEEFRLAYNDLVDEVGGIGSLRTSQKGSVVDAVNSIIDQYFFFQDFEYDGSDGSSSNRTFSGSDNFSKTLNYSVNRLLVFKNGVLLRNGTDYSAANGTSITLSSSAANSDIIRITSFTGSYEGTAGATEAATTQWTKTGGGSIYNHDTTAGVVINSDDTGVVTTPASGYGIQLESDGSNIYLNTGGTSKEVFVNGNLNLTSGATIKVNGSQITSSAISGFDAAVRGKISASGDITYNNSTGVISFSQAGAPVTSVFGRTGAVALTTADVTGVVNTSNLTENTNLFFTNERVDDRVNALLQAGTNMSLSYNDSAGTLTINSSGKTQEEIEDIVGTMFTSNTENGLSVTYDDSDGTLDVDVDDFSITLTGDVTGTGTVTNLGNVSFATTVAANSVALGTDTTGNYVGTLTAGTALTSSGATSGEGIAHSISLDNTSVTAGSYGSTTAIPTFTVDAQGRLTAASTVTVDTYSGWSAGGDSGAGTVPEGTTINWIGGEGIDTSFSGTTLTIAGELATTTNKGVASFNSTDFSVSSGVVSIVHEHIEDIVGGMLSGSGGTSVTYNDGTGVVTINSTAPHYTSAIAVGDGGLTQKNFTTTLKTKLDGIAANATNTAAPHYTSAIAVGDGGLTQKNFTTTLKNKLDGIAAGATNTAAPHYTSAIAVGDGGLTQKNFTTTLKNKLDGIAAGATTYTSNQATNTNSTVLFGEVRSSGNITAYYSDDRLKTRLGSIKNPLDKVCSLNGFYFKQNEKGNEITPQYEDMMQVGISAQEIKSVLPEVVVENAIEDQYDSVHYDKVVPLLIEAIKELKSEIESLKS